MSAEEEVLMSPNMVDFFRKFFPLRNCSCDVCSEMASKGCDYYTAENGLTASDVIDSFGMNFNLGNVIKYCIRCGKKGNDIEDLEKAANYIKREIQWRKRNGFKAQ